MQHTMLNTTRLKQGQQRVWPDPSLRLSRMPGRRGSLKREASCQSTQGSPPSSPPVSPLLPWLSLDAQSYDHVVVSHTWGRDVLPNTPTSLREPHLYVSHPIKNWPSPCLSNTTSDLYPILPFAVAAFVTIPAALRRFICLGDLVACLYTWNFGHCLSLLSVQIFS